MHRGKAVRGMVMVPMGIALFACTRFGLGPGWPELSPLDVQLIPIHCDPLMPADTVRVVVDRDAPGTTRIYYPEGDPDEAMAQLIVPQGALNETTTFTLAAPSRTDLVTIDVDARGSNAAVEPTFREPLRLVLYARPRRNCVIPDSIENDIYLYHMGDSIFINERGEFDTNSRPVARGGELETPATFDPRARTLVDDFSGFLVAQGRSRSP